MSRQTSKQNINRLDQGFPPLVGTNARILVLGSMPGQQSLKQQQYYGNPNNAFWRIMHDLIGVDSSVDYTQRCIELTHAGIAVWDVISACIRPGSLDSAIRSESIVANDFADFFAVHESIEAVYLNGQRAATEYQRRVLPTLDKRQQAIPAHTLLSTSPANARFRYAEKLENWRDILRVL